MLEGTWGIGEMDTDFGRWSARREKIGDEFRACEKRYRTRLHHPKIMSGRFRTRACVLIGRAYATCGRRANRKKTQRRAPMFFATQAPSR
jgi:hypothetical protein